MIRPLQELIVGFHQGQHLCITAFDSGPIRPNDEVISLGWRVQGNVMVSPPLFDGLAIPCDNHDEWYVIAHPAFPLSTYEVFVNYGGFTLLDPAEIYKTYDATWEKNALDWLRPIQDQFWRQLGQIQPETYVSCGENDIVVTRKQTFFDAVRRSVEK